MLKITAVTDTTGRYLLDDPASEIADLFDGTRPGQWSGRSAGRHGLNGDVRENDLGWTGPRRDAATERTAAQNRP